MSSQWPKDFVLDDKKRKYAIEKGLDPAKLDDWWDDFHDWSIAHGAKYKDWDAAFRMRVRKTKQYTPEYLRQRTSNIAPRVAYNVNHAQSQAYMTISANPGCDLLKFRDWCRSKLNMPDKHITEVLYKYLGVTGSAKELIGGIG